ncbi:hypothetical protein GYMLUDRAFT_689028 [Collybiopsis luxurians FD-317 M1]|uniref:Uncharacterized protein n=1 Tax=Collybiopsis luxurians FD-317 M1 TaxID=944289 RepID=A0A0D0C865_9AGAR|nr:hypothetical protein GYMLUDRAFT_689028 [Collybiopsis luxurians FD-317 M1]
MNRRNRQIRTQLRASPSQTPSKSLRQPSSSQSIHAPNPWLQGLRQLEQSPLPSITSSLEPVNAPSNHSWESKGLGLDGLAVTIS